MTKHIKESIIVPMNPHGEYSGGSTPGSIIAQQWFADKTGKVVISFDKGCKYINSLKKPRFGFFYDSSKGIKKVTHRFSLIDVIDDTGVGKYVKFLPPWRQDLYETKPEEGKHRTWIVISEIRALDEPKKLDYFGKKRAQSFVYSSKGSELKYSGKSQSPDDLIDDVVFRTARGYDKFTEDDLELIIWALMVKNDSEYIRRQRKIEGKNLRLDLLAKTSKGEYLVMELKRGIATKETLYNQLRPYMNGIKNDLGLQILRGIIIARDVSTDLKEELCKPENIDIEFIPYMFSFKLKGIEDHIF